MNNKTSNSNLRNYFKKHFLLINNEDDLVVSLFILTGEHGDLNQTLNVCMYVETDTPPIPTPRISVKLTLIKTKHRTYYAMTGSHKERWQDWQFECLMITTLWWWLVHGLVLCWLNFAAELISIFYNQLHRPQLHPVLSQSTGMWKVVVLYLTSVQNSRVKILGKNSLLTEFVRWDKGTI